MLKNLAAGIMMVALLALCACGGGEADYSDAIEVNRDFIDAMKVYLDDIDAAQSGSAMAGAINSYADRMEALAPRMKEIAQKYPSWKDRAKMPEAMKPLAEEAEVLAKRLAGSMMKAMQYAQDPEVQAAQQRFIQSMANMNQ